MNGAVPDLELRGLTKVFGRARAVDGLDLQIEKGEFVSLLGPSGCGKSTTLLMIAGFELPTEGEIRVRGRAVQDLAPDRRNVGIVFQSYALFPHMSVRQNVEYGLRMRKVPADERRRRSDELLRMVHMHEHADRSTRLLSGGQQQRVAVARALVIEPNLLLLDEPFSALDRKLREEFQREVRALQRKLGITTIFVTHDQEEALLMSDRVAVMNRGRIEQCASPETLYREPATRFVADFVGRGSFVEAAEADGADLGGVEAFFRPEDAMPAGQPGDARFAGTIQALYFQGASTFADVVLARTGKPVIVDASPWVRTRTLEPGAAFSFHVPRDRLRPFGGAA